MTIFISFVVVQSLEDTNNIFLCICSSIGRIADAVTCFSDESASVKYDRGSKTLTTASRVENLVSVGIL